jgi:hypothetical protein
VTLQPISQVPLQELADFQRTAISAEIVQPPINLRGPFRVGRACKSAR